MFSLPLPILTFLLSAVACALMWRLHLGNALARGLFTAVFVLIAVSPLLIGLRFGYGVTAFLTLQPLIPLFIGPLMYLGFLAFARPAVVVRKWAAVHLGVATIAAVAPLVVPVIRAGFDLMIGLSYLFYGLRLLALWRRGADGLALAPLGLTRGVRQWMLCAAGMLGIMLVFDTAVAISFELGRSEDALQLISLGSAVSMVALTLAIFVFSKGNQEAAPIRNVDRAADQASVRLEQSARDFLVESQLYLDTDLTLERLAKRLHVPARALSEAINQTQKVNVSQYVNGFRLTHAAGLLETSNASVIKVMEQSGFLTRSNFYREFERVYAQSPVEYRKQAAK